MYTSGQVADMLATPPSTLRRYVKIYGKHLSESATKKRGRRFTERDVATLARARSLLQQGRTPKETNDLLAVVGEDAPEVEPDAALMLVPSISAALTEALDATQSLRADVSTLAEQVESVSDSQEETRAALTLIREYMRLPFYRRWLSGPPLDE